VSSFVTWNARHFQGKTLLSVLTPEEYLKPHDLPVFNQQDNTELKQTQPVSGS
jgi:hypothetical protein